MAAKKKTVFREITLWDVVLSYPDLNDPKPYKGKINYRTDVLMEKKSQVLKDLKAAIMEVATEAFGDDQSEWPEKIMMPKDGDEREDSKGYAGMRFVTPSTQKPVPIVDLKGKAMNAAIVKAGQFANVAVRVSSWEYDNDEGISIYLQGVQIDTSKKALDFGAGGKSVEAMFSRKGKAPAAAEDELDEDTDTDADDEDETPPPAKSKKAPAKKKPARNFDDEDED